MIESFNTIEFLNLFGQLKQFFANCSLLLKVAFLLSLPDEQFISVIELLHFQLLLNVSVSLRRTN